MLQFKIPQTEPRTGVTVTNLEKALFRYQKWRERNLRGWRFGISFGAFLSFAVFLLNLAITVGASAWEKDGQDGRKILYEGNCNKVRKLNIGAHILINGLSTILLSASNYSMQCLSAPTRKEVDKAHAKGDWLDIGVWSLRNILKISRMRSFLWFLLGASSLPLHLFYNSAVYASITAQDYVIFSANPEMLLSNSTSAPLGVPELNKYHAVAAQMHSLATEQKLEYLDARSCINTYAKVYQTGRANLILVTNSSDLASPYLYDNAYATLYPGSYNCMPDPFGWVCGQGERKARLECQITSCSSVFSQTDPANWSPLGQKVDYCLSQRAQEMCTLQFTPKIAWVVVAFNLAKAIIMVAAVVLVKQNPLMTIGDAIQSFLVRKDPSTQFLCLMSKDELEWRSKAMSASTCVPPPRKYEPKKKKWSSVVSNGRWTTCMILFSLAILVTLGLFLHGIVNRNARTTDLMKIPLGSIDPRTFIRGWSNPSSGTVGLISNTLTANIPQVILSGIYFTYNALFTAFLLSDEWCDFATRRKSLRVSSEPRGFQRCSYFLQLPYSYSACLMILSGVLHWLCSQSIFLVSLQISNSAPDDSIWKARWDALGDEFMTCGYSPQAMLSVLSLAMAMVIFAIIMGRRVFRPGIPVAGSCSASLAAACHQLNREDGYETAGAEIKWGVTHSLPSSIDGQQVGHCSFSIHDVTMPVEGQLYQ